MNTLAQLVADLDLDESLVLRRLKADGLVDQDCCFLDDVPESKCRAAKNLVMAVLHEVCE